MSTEKQPIEVGDRFLSKDKRDGGRIVEVIAALPVDAWYSNPHVSEYTRQGGTRFKVRTEVNPSNPTAVGHVSRTSERTLRTGYKRVSR
jgi:hypothetical protein